MYVCRTLSYKGAEFEVVEIPLEAKMMVYPNSFYYEYKNLNMFKLVTFGQLYLKTKNVTSLAFI